VLHFLTDIRPIKLQSPVNDIPFPSPWKLDL